MGKSMVRVAAFYLCFSWLSFSAWGQQWVAFRFEYSKYERGSDEAQSFQGDIRYRLSYEVDGRERRWITHYAQGGGGSEGHLIDFSVPPGSGKLILELQDLRWGSDAHNNVSNFISLRTDVDIRLSEGFVVPGGRRVIIRNPDEQSASFVFPFDPARISQPGSGSVTGRMAVQLQVLTDGRSQLRNLLDFQYQLRFTPRAGVRPDTLFPRAVAPPPVEAELPPAAPVDTVEALPVLPGPAEFSVSARPVDLAAGRVVLSLWHQHARKIGEFRLSFQKRPASGGSWQEVPYQNYKLEQLDDRRPREGDAFRIIYRDFGPGEYLVLASRGSDHDSTFFRIDPAGQTPAADFVQDGGHLHLRIRGGEPPFQLQYRHKGTEAWSAAFLNDSLYHDPLLTCFEDLQVKVPAFQRNGTYDIRILNAAGTPLVEHASLVIDRPWQGWRTLGWAGATLLVVGIIAFLRYRWWKSRTFYERS